MKTKISIVLAVAMIVVVSIDILVAFRRTGFQPPPLQPDGKKVFAVCHPQQSIAEIQSIIDICPPNQVIGFCNGIYVLTNAIRLVGSNITIRGSGKTVFNMQLKSTLPIKIQETL